MASTSGGHDVHSAMAAIQALGGLDAVGARLADANTPFEPALLDNLFMCLRDPRLPLFKQANATLMRLKEHPDMWQRAHAILESAQDEQARFFGLSVLDDAIGTRWQVIPAEQREGVKNYVVNKVIALSSEEASYRANKRIVAKMNGVLVNILKQEWPHNWPSFVGDIVGASRTSEVLCENNMQILKLLSEEVFDYSKDAMTTTKTKALKESLNADFAKIYQLCEFILGASERPSLLNVTLQTLQRFLTWIPLGYIFETQLLSTLINKFFPVPDFRTSALQCLTEVASLNDLEPSKDPFFRDMYLEFLKKLGDIMQLDTNLALAYESGSPADQDFIQRLSLFFTSYFKHHMALLEVEQHTQALLKGLFYLVKISAVPDNEIFKICLEYWHSFAANLYNSDLALAGTGGGGGAMQAGGLALNATQQAPSRKQLFQVNGLLSQVRLVLISKMAKPEEVLIVEDPDSGEIVRETTKDTEAIAQYKTMRETLVYFTHLNYEDTETIMLDKLSFQVDGTEWSWNNLNTLCWAIGSISGAMVEEDEKRFLVTVIKDLLGLCEMKHGKDNKAVVASNIMYVVGQYPRFLRAHWKFLKTVVNKLFEFMHEDMACDTFLKIAGRCKRKFVMQQQGEQMPFIEELCGQLPLIISDLESYQVHTFYAAAACMLSESGHGVTVNRAALLARLMEVPNTNWRRLMADAAASGAASLLSPEAVREVTKTVHTNVRVCAAVGPLYINQLGTCYLDILNVYKCYSNHISQAVATQGETATRHSLIRSMRAAKREILRLLTTFIEKCGEPEAGPAVVAQSFIPPLIDPVLGDYAGSVPGARDPEVLALFAAAIEKLRDHVSAEVPRIMQGVFEPTLTMITQNFEDFPETRLKFFKFLRAVNACAFQALFSIPPEHQKLVVDAVIWAFKHTERTVAETGLDILHELLTNVHQTPAVAQGFYASFLLSVLGDVLGVMTDRLHKSGFKQHAALLRHIFHLVETGGVTVPLFDVTQHAAGTTNQQFLREHVAQYLLNMFPNLTRAQVLGFVTGCFDLNMDPLTFKTHLRDFLIQIKEFSVENNADLFREEQLAERERLRQEDLVRRMAVPGVLNPHHGTDTAAGAAAAPPPGGMEEDL